VLIVFYAILFGAALVNLPASWFGALYSSLGLLAGLAGVVYCFRRRTTLLILFLPAVILMLLTLMGVTRR
jgi:hypothetical protein